MALEIHFHCDDDGCDLYQTAAFDNESETYGQLLDHMRDINWQIELRDNPQPGIDGTVTRCPAHHTPRLSG